MAAGADEVCKFESLFQDDPLWDVSDVASPPDLLPEEPEGVPGLDDLLRGLLPEVPAAAAPPRLLTDGDGDEDLPEEAVEVFATDRSEDCRQEAPEAPLGGAAQAREPPGPREPAAEEWAPRGAGAARPGAADDDGCAGEEDDVLDDEDDDVVAELEAPQALPAAQERRSSFEEDFCPQPPDEPRGSAAQHAQASPAETAPAREEPPSGAAARPPSGPRPERPSPRAAAVVTPPAAPSGAHVVVTEAPRSPSASSRAAPMSPSSRGAPMSPTPSMAPSISSRNRARWRENTQENLANAKALTTEVFNSLLAEELGQAGKVGIGEKRQQVNLTIKRKIAATEDMTKTLEERVSRVEDSIRQAGECMFQLQRAHRAKAAPLSVCERRLELRAARPGQERVVDQCQAALEAERRTLEDSRGELLRLAGDAAQSLLRLDAVKGELVRDLQAKRQSLRMDRSCISARKPISGQETRLPSLQATDQRQAASARRATAADAGMLIARAVRAEEDSLRLCTESDAFMRRSHRACGDAAAKSQASLQHRIQEISMLKKNLEAQKAETEEAIGKTELALAKNRKNLDLYDQPLRAVSAQLATTGSGAAGGGQEPLGPHRHALEGQLELLQQGARELEGKCKAGEELLERLRASKGQTLEDLRCKAAAKAIDDHCMKVTARKAMGLDVSSLPSAQLQSRETGQRLVALAGP